MPLACDPSKTFDVWLSSDADKPEHERPTFVFRYINNREFCAVGEAMDGLSKHESVTAAVTVCMDQIRVGLVGWRHMPDPENPGEALAYDPSKLDLILSHTETHELIQRMQYGARPGGDDLGK